MNVLRRFQSRVERAALAEASDSRAGTEGILSLPDWLWSLPYLSFFAALAVTFLCLCLVRFAAQRNHLMTIMRTCSNRGTGVAESLRGCIDVLRVKAKGLL